MPDTAPADAALGPFVVAGRVPGLVALVGRDGPDGPVETTVLGRRAFDGPAMTPDSIMRIASITKPITAAATMVLVDEGVLTLDDPVARWLPELAEPQVLRTPRSDLDDVVPAARPITVRHLLTFTAGHGFPPDFSLPYVARLAQELGQGPDPTRLAPPQEWLRRLSGIPLLHQPGEGWTYNTGSDILGVLLSRAARQPLEQLFAERLFEPIGMPDTGFWVPADRLDRLCHAYAAAPEGARPELVDAPPGRWATPPQFPSGASGLVSTAPDWLAFGRMLLAGGVTASGTRVLTEESVAAMLRDQLTPTQRAGVQIFLGQGSWGFGGSVDLVTTRWGTVAGRYGWIGGSGTAGHVCPATGTVQVLMSQVALAGPTDLTLARAFWKATS